MGTTAALATILPKLIKAYTTFRQGKKFNDQEAMTFLAAGKVATAPYRVAKDVHQTLIGSMVYAHPYSHLLDAIKDTVRPAHRKVSCFDFREKRHEIGACFGSDDVGPPKSGGGHELFSVGEPPRSPRHRRASALAAMLASPPTASQRGASRKHKHRRLGLCS